MRAPFRLLVTGISALLLAVATWRMWSLHAAEQLWGWWPLPFLLGGWGLVVGLRQNPSRIKPLAIATVAGLGLGVGFAVGRVGILLFVGFAAMLLLVDELAESDAPRRRMWWYGYHAMVVFNVTATWWVANAALAAGVVANFLNALLMTVPWVLTYAVRRRMPDVWLPAAVALWIGFEYLHYNWQIAWPWLTLGNGFAGHEVFWYRYTGVFGGSLWVGLAGIGFFSLTRSRLRGERVPVRRLVGFFLVPVFAPPLVSIVLARLVLAADDARPPGAVVRLVQPNLEPHYEKFAVPDREQLARFAELAAPDGGSGRPPHLVVFPETSFGSYDEARLGGTPLARMWRRTRKAYAAIGPEPPPDLLTGLSTHRRYDQRPDDPAVRTQADGRGGELFYTAHNTAVSIVGDSIAGLYHKSRLVPGVEFLPYRRLLFFFEPLVDRLGGTLAGLGIDPAPQVFDYPSGIRAAPLICYESVYGDYVREYVRRGANLLVVPTNDGWWDDTPGYRQHFRFAGLRAVETNRYVVQAANSGISGVAKPTGYATPFLGYGEQEAVNVTVELLEGETFYVRVGDLVGRVSAGASVLLLISLLARRLQRAGGT